MARSLEPSVRPAEAAPVRAVSGRSLSANLLLSLRPRQWTKNVLVFAGLIFSQRLLDANAAAQALGAFAAFCLLSGVVYLVNDVADREGDRMHPVKSRRPIASGALSVGTAVGAAIALTAAGVGLAFWLAPKFGFVAVVYVALLGVYSASLKHVVILDVLTIALGFVLRAIGGAVAIGVAFSDWLLLLTLLGALFLALSKRRAELVMLADDATGHRRILAEYSPYLLDQMIGVVTASTLLAYAFYTISPETVGKFGTTNLLYTVPFLLYGIFRYLYLVHQREGGGDPSELLVTDRPLLTCVGLYVVAVVVILYGPWR